MEVYEDLLSRATALGPVGLYRELDVHEKEIRLLTVQPGAGAAPVRCDLRHVSLSPVLPPSYETVSYVWGDHTIRGSIYLSGQVVDVPISTEIVLRRMRHKREQRVLWIDAVCINQNDLDERASQVSLMAEIYGKTSQNLIWLGEDENGSATRAVDGISAILEEMRIETNGFRDLTKRIYATFGNFLLSDTAITAQVDWTALLEFFSSPWFTRVWIVQEASMPFRSVCFRGSIEISLEHVLRAACWVTHKLKFLHSNHSTRGIKCALAIFMYADREFGRHNILYNRDVQSTYLSLLLGSLRDFDCYDTRDYVFGMLGLYKKHMRCTDFPSQLAPTYRTSCEVVFRNAARLTITTERNLGILRDVRRRPRGDTEAMPSWVPLWHQRYDSETDQREFAVSGFSADAGERLDVSCLDDTGDPDSLTVKGAVVGTVRDTAFVSRQSLVKEGVPALRTYLDAVHKISGAATHDLPSHTKLAHTLTAGVDWRGVQVDEAQSATWYAAFRYSTFTRCEFPDLLSSTSAVTPTDSRNASIYWQALANSCLNRRFFVTDQGHVGLGNLMMQAGDIVAVLFGSDFPLILRPLNREGGGYKLIGYCYVYGMMKGEAVHAHRATGQADTVFRLR